MVDSWFSIPAGGVSPATALVMLESKESRDDRPAKVSFEEEPPGRKKSSKVFIAPALLAKSLACRTWVVVRHEGPRI